CLRTNNGMPTPPLTASVCASGTAELGGTGFGDQAPTECQDTNVDATLGASTGWLTTSAPVKPGEQFTLELMIWDPAAGYLDSRVRVDHFQWLGGDVSTVTTPVK